jgi:RHS repeat-associated protein
MKLRIPLPLLLFAALAYSSLFAQTGNPPFATVSGGSVDSINLSALNTHVEIPVFGKAGRGLPFSYAINVDTSIWQTSVNVGTGAKSWLPLANFGWRGLTESFIGYVSYTQTQTTCNASPFNATTKYTGFTYHDSRGGSHFGGNMVDSTGCFGGPHDIEHALDGSGYILDVTLSGSSISVKVYTPSGSTIIAPLQAQNDPNIFVYPTPVGSGTITDSNGNQLSVSAVGTTVTFTDTLNTTVMSIDSSDPTAIKYHYTGPDGNVASITMDYAQFSVRTNFGVANTAEYSALAMLPTQIVFPDASFYQFGYETTPGGTDITGRLASIKLPTGGTISYAYTGGTNGILPDGTIPGLTRKIGSDQWTYVRNVPASGPSTMTITDPTPDHNQTVFTFSGMHELKRQIYHGSAQAGTLLDTQLTCYNFNTVGCDTSSVNGNISAVDVYDQLPGGLQSHTLTSFDSVGNPIEIDQFDYGTGGAGPLLRKTATGYASLSNNIIGKPAWISITDSTGRTISEQSFNYDEFGVTTTSEPQHIGIAGSRGNLTSIQQLSFVSPTAPNQYLLKKFSYYDTGALNTYTDVNGAMTTYNYGAGACNNSFPTSVSFPVGLSISTIWDCVGGVITSATDENQKATTFVYTVTSDPSIWRVKQRTDPSGNLLTTTYGISTNESALQFNGGLSTVDIFATFDSYGQPSTAQIRQAPGGSSFDSFETDHDSLGRISRATAPYAGAAGVTNPNAPAVTTIYDAMNRITQQTGSSGSFVQYIYNGTNDTLAQEGPAAVGENLKQKQFEFDGLGRLTSVCEITNLQGSGPCGQTTPATGFATRYTYDALNNLLAVTQNAQSGSQQVRTFSYDPLNRRTSETSPESGTVNFVYDSDPSGACATSNPGDLVRRVDAAGVSTCYSYDARRRMTSAVSSGIGVVTVSGSEQNIQAPVPSPGMGSVTITGSERSKIISTRYCAAFDNHGRCVDWEFDTSTVYDSGTVTITVNGHSNSVTYSSGSSSASVANGLASVINADANAFINASASNDVLSMTARQTGTGSNYSWSISSSSSDSVDFGAAGSFTGSPTFGALAGGGTSNQTIYDAGTVYATINGTTVSTTYGQNDTTLTVASTLVNAINASTTFPATASFLFPARIELLPKQPGSYSLTAGSSSNVGSFTGNPSFAAQWGATTGMDLSRKTSFVYDAATVNGQAMANAKGRLAEAVTCTSPCAPSNVLTDLGFSYDALGNVSDTYESTPHSGGYYHLSSTYWPNDLLHTLGGLPGLPVFTFLPDSEGRISVINASVGQNPVTNTTFNSASQVTAVTFGSGDHDTYSIDPGTGRIGQFSAFIGTSNLNALLTWNTNGSLATLAVTDPFNSAANQTCSYGYDDLSRLGSVTCGSAWAQTFSYDPFGNISKSGSLAFQPTYQSTTNRIQALPGFTPSYNANGALLSDGAHTYTWDAQGNLSSLDSVGLVYDALGRMVEQVRGATFTQIVYSPTGDKLALMNGQALQKAFLSLPGGATAVYNSSGLAYYRHPDWLGSGRLASTPSKSLYSDSSYAPFGEPYAQSGTADPSFTGKNQDTATGLYDFLYREYSPTQGRWISCDPIGDAAADPSNPQTWNKYAYVLNNPLGLVDPTGLEDKPPCKNLIILGITDTPTMDKPKNNDGMAEVEDLARKYGFNVAFPYAGLSGGASLVDMMRQGGGTTTAATKDAMEALQYTISQGGTTVINFSGGAQAYSSAMGKFNSDSSTAGSSGKIPFVINLSPGSAGTSLVSGADSTTRYRASGVIDATVNLTAPNEAGQANGGKFEKCGHNAACEIRNFLDRCGEACKSPCSSLIFTRNSHGPRGNNQPPPDPFPTIDHNCTPTDDGWVCTTTINLPRPDDWFFGGGNPGGGNPFGCALGRCPYW